MSTHHFKAVLFDFDGVLAVTMEDNFSAWQATLRDYYVDLAPDEYYPLEGMSLKDLAEQYIAEKKIDAVDPQDIVKAKERYYLLQHTFRLYPHVEEYVTRLANRSVPIAIVSAALADRLKASVPSSFLSLFTALVTGDVVPRGKPFPDPYLIGAQKLQTPIAECIVIENAPSGITAAKRAGAFCIAISSTLPSDLLRDADVIVPSFAELTTIPAFNELVGLELDA